MTVVFRVTGRVQGVGFRIHVQRCAARLMLVGEVWNTLDGAVDGWATGDPATLAAFEAAVRDGPGHVASAVFSETTGRPGDAFHVGPNR